MAADLEYDIKEIDDLLFKMKSFKNAYIESSELESRTTKISSLLEFLNNYSSKYNNCMSEYDFINYKKKISSSVNNFTDDYLDLYKSTEYSRTLLNLGTASATQILNQFSGVATYGNSSSYGNSSFTPKTKTPSTTPKDTDDDTGADGTENGTTAPYTQNPGNGDTAAHPTDDGTSKDPKVDEEEKKRKEEEQKRQEEEKKRKEEEQKRKEEEKKRKEEEQKRKEEEKKRKEEEQKRQEEEQKRKEEEQKRKEEEQKRQEEERRRQEEEQKRKEDNSNTGSEVAIPTGPSSSDNNNRTPERVTVPNTETTDNPVAAGIETSKPEATTTTDSASTSVVGETKDLFKNKKTPDSKTGTGTTLPKSESTKTTSTTSSSKGFNAVPIAVGLGAAVAGGVGLKAYKDHKENAKFDDENEDSFSNGNRFWSEEDPSVINSEETAVSGDDLFTEQTTSPSYSAMVNDTSQDDGGWSLDESTTQPEEAFDLLGDN